MLFEKYFHIVYKMCGGARVKADLVS